MTEEIEELCKVWQYQMSGRNVWSCLAEFIVNKTDLRGILNFIISPGRVRNIPGKTKDLIICQRQLVKVSVQWGQGQVALLDM